MGWAEEMSEQSPRRSDVLRASPSMFESRLLDALSRVHPLVPVLIFAPAIALLAAWSLSKHSVAGSAGAGGRRLRAGDPVRVLASPARVPLRAPRGAGSALALDHPRRAPRPSQRPP